MKFALAMYTGSTNPKFYGIKREWFAGGSNGDTARWTPVFEGAVKMDLETALAVYKMLDSPVRKLGLVPIE